MSWKNCSTSARPFWSSSFSFSRLAGRLSALDMTACRKSAPALLLLLLLLLLLGVEGGGARWFDTPLGDATSREEGAGDDGCPISNMEVRELAHGAAGGANVNMSGASMLPPSMMARRIAANDRIVAVAGSGAPGSQIVRTTSPGRRRASGESDRSPPSTHRSTAPLPPFSAFADGFLLVVLRLLPLPPPPLLLLLLPPPASASSSGGTI